MPKNKEMKRLTECEELVMKVVWDSDEELALIEIMNRVNSKFNKEWKPQTVSTFLARLVGKGYLHHYRGGRLFYYQILIPLEDYKAHITDEYVKFWNHGNADEFLSTLLDIRELRSDEVERIKELVC